MKEKLVLGTAQFGLDYGLTNKFGRIKEIEVLDILNCARKYGIKNLDTAFLYGKSQSVLGHLGVGDFNIVTKLPPVIIGGGFNKNFLVETLMVSLKVLNVKSIYGLLLHRPMELLDPINGKGILNALKSLKDTGEVKKLGVSVYSPNELISVLEVFVPDIVQLPFNPFDQRFLNLGLLKMLRGLGCEIFARSIFLQGLLLQDHNEKNPYFYRWNNNFKMFEDWLKKKCISRLAACVGFAVSEPLIDKVIIGIDSSSHLREIIATENSEYDNSLGFLALDDENLLNPSKWQLN